MCWRARFVYTNVEQSGQEKFVLLIQFEKGWVLSRVWWATNTLSTKCSTTRLSVSLTLFWTSCSPCDALLRSIICMIYAQLWITVWWFVETSSYVKFALVSCCVDVMERYPGLLDGMLASMFKTYKHPRELVVETRPDVVPNANHTWLFVAPEMSFIQCDVDANASVTRCNYPAAVRRLPNTDTRFSSLLLGWHFLTYHTLGQFCDHYSNSIQFRLRYTIEYTLHRIEYALFSDPHRVIYNCISNPYNN